MASRTAKTILEGFNKLIVEHDFHKITVDMIMKAAEVSRATFYRYFKDKYDVMNANFKNVLDYYVSPEQSTNYRDLCFHLFQYGLEHLQVFKKAMESTGFNSFSNFISDFVRYSESTFSVASWTFCHDFLNFINIIFFTDTFIYIVF